MISILKSNKTLTVLMLSAMPLVLMPISVKAQDTMDVPAEEILDEPEVFFDSTAVAPGSTPTQSNAPRQVDPREQPGQSFIIVKKNAAAGSYESEVVAANRALKLGRNTAALDMFEALYKRNPRDVRVLMGKAVAQQRSGFSASAIQTYEDVLKRDPGNKEAMVNMLGLMKNQFPETTLRRLLDLRERYPNSPGIAAQIGMTQADLGQYKDAMRFLGIAASLEPNNAVHIFNMAVLNDRKGNKSEAISMYEEALKIDALHGASRSIQRETVYDRLSTLRRM
ncbi:MAG: tetratricopeptide repeat protein [Pseudomonadota bacterium]